MKRVGKRGEGKFEQISWDEAVDTIASELKRIIDEYGNESVYIPYATGVSSTTARSLPRFMNCLGGFLGSYGDYSAMQMEMIVPHTYGASGFSGSTLNAAEAPRSSRSARARPRRARAAPCRTTTGCICARPRRAR
ncbi:MAG: molybdopterin-dependent oxidoreductase [Eggerthellaceae bacterium]